MAEIVKTLEQEKDEYIEKDLRNKFDSCDDSRVFEFIQQAKDFHFNDLVSEFISRLDEDEARVYNMIHGEPEENINPS